jgi:hypothetical protein
MSDFSFLKTGTHSENNYEETILKQALSMYMIFTEDALKLAGVYTVHLGGKLVKEDVILKALKIRAFNGEMFWNQPGIQQRLKETEDELNDLLDEETSENLEVSETEITQEMLDFKLKTDCLCVLCKNFNEIESNWETWEPTIDIDKSLKIMIDKVQKKVYG